MSVKEEALEEEDVRESVEQALADLAMKLLDGLAALLLIPVSLAIRGAVLMYLWAWLVAPVYQLPTLAFVQAMGLSLIVAWVTVPRRSDEKRRKALHSLGTMTIAALIFLACGYVLSLCL